MINPTDPPSVMLRGLTPRQCLIADMLWAADDPIPVIDSLPVEDQAQAHSLMTMMIHELMEQDLPAFEYEAADIIDRVKG